VNLSVIDVQCHIFPRSFVKELSKSNSELRISAPDQNGRRVIVDSKTDDEVTFFVENSPYVDPEQHLKDMRKYNIAIQILSLPPPSVDKIQEPNEALKMSKLVNNEIAEIVTNHPDRFQGLATIPMFDSEDAREEIKRAVEELGLRGIIISSNTNGKFYDSKDFDVVFDTLQKYDVPVFIHPTESVAAKQIGQDYKLALIYGWPFDTTISISRLIFSGTLKRFPRLKIISAHGGGMVPFFKGRINMLARVAAGSGKKIVDGDPVETFKNIYYDAALFDADSLALLLKFVGAEHIVFASDYPFGQNLGKNCYEGAMKMMNELKASEDEKEKIFSGTASKIFKLG
jgi:predicted TIM-barrel fold metal-dependent hydrolase